MTREVFKLINSLASINNTKQEAEQAKKFVEENWDEFRRDFESTSRKKRYSTGDIERDLFKLIANVCDWKTNKDYMRIASQIMILCEYNSYKINKDRFKQKIQNILKKEKNKSPKMEGKKRKRTNKKKKIESDISDSISQVNIHGKQKQTMRTYTYYDFVNYLSPTIIHSYRKNKL